MKTRRQLLAAAKKSPEDGALLSQIAASYSREEKYQKALDYDLLALQTNPSNALYARNVAINLGMLRKNELAVKALKLILRCKLETICRHTQVDVTEAKVIKNDARYRLSVEYWVLDDMNLARRYLNLYFSIKKRDQLSTGISDKNQREHWMDLNPNKEWQQL